MTFFEKLMIILLAILAMVLLLIVLFGCQSNPKPERPLCSPVRETTDTLFTDPLDELLRDCEYRLERCYEQRCKRAHS